MMDIKIEKDVPVSVRQKPSEYREALRGLEVGDSFFLAETTGAQASSMFHKPSQTLGIKLTVRTVEGGARVWRV